MKRKNSMDHKSQESDTQSNISSDFDELNYARIQDTPISPNFLTPTKSLAKAKRSKMQIQLSNDAQQEEDQDWKTQHTKTVIEGSGEKSVLSPQEQLDLLAIKYPKQIKNTKKGTITVQKLNKNCGNYENLCSICLDHHANTRGLLKCGHKFCFECIEQWTKTSTNCPCCRQKFTNIVKVQINEKKIELSREVVAVQVKQMQYNQLDYFVCYGCGRGDDQDVLLICDMCEFYSCHVYCDASLANVFPVGDWYCRHCKVTIDQNRREAQRISNNVSTRRVRVGQTQSIQSATSNSEQNNTSSQISLRTRARTALIEQLFRDQSSSQPPPSETQSGNSSQGAEEDYSDSARQSFRLTRAMRKQRFTRSNLKFDRKMYEQRHNTFSNLIDNLMSTRIGLRNLRRRRL